MNNKKVSNTTNKDIAYFAKKTHLKDSNSTNTYKKHKIKQHHAKPFRKRHYGSLFILIGCLFISVLILINLSLIFNKNTNNAKQYLVDNFASKNDINQNIISSLGYSLQFNPNNYYAAGITSADNKLYIGSDLSSTKDYKTIVISSNQLNKTSKDGSVTINYSKTNKNLPNIDLQNELVESESTANSKLVQTSTNNIKIDNVNFIKSNWYRQYTNNNNIPKLNALITTYVANLNGSEIKVVINHGLIKENPDFIKIIENLNFNIESLNKSAYLPYSIQPESSKSILDKIFLNGIAKASENSIIPSEKIASMYSPAVVKIYNLYCQNAKIDGVVYMQTLCNGSIGSGFLISNDGYIATNGHVTSSSVKEMLISYAIEEIYLGNDTVISKLYEIAGGTEKDFEGKTQQEAGSMVFDKIYQIPDSRFSSDDSTHNMLVALGEDQPDINSLKDLTAQKLNFTETNNIKLAKQIAIDYRAYDGIGGFKASDVALIKISGNNYPNVKIGNFDKATQGSNLNIIGFPASASANGLVEEKTSRSTLTTGKVTSIKDVNGSSNKLIETDSTIGHGNSGGPAFLDSGEVIGIATYTIDGSGEGNGVFNYVRSISDLNVLLAQANIRLNTQGKTQLEWNKGIDNFYKAHYSKAIKNFESAKENYAIHPTADALIATSKARIASGEEVNELPIIAILIVSITVILMLIATMVVIIIKHKRKHNLYKQLNNSNQNINSSSEQSNSDLNINNPINTTSASTYQQENQVITNEHSRQIQQVTQNFAPNVNITKNLNSSANTNTNYYANNLEAESTQPKQPAIKPQNQYEQIIQPTNINNQNIPTISQNNTGQ